MKSSRLMMLGAALVTALGLLGSATALADARPGTVVWSDGHKDTGDISMLPGKDLRIFTTNGSPFQIQLDEVREMRFTPTNEQMWKGFYFPNAGQSTIAYTGEVYPLREITSEITLNNGKVLDGHLFTTALYVENDAGTEKIVLVSKQTGTNGQKLTDLLYPTDIRFDAGAASPGTSQIDLTQANLSMTKPPVFVSRPDLSPLPALQTDGKPVWSVPLGDPTMLFFSVQAADGVHVAWPADPPSGPAVDPDIQQAAQTMVKVMNDFYDTRTLLGCFADSNDVYSLIAMKRLGDTADIEANQIPWAVEIFHSKYDPDKKQIVAQLNSSTLAVGNAPRSGQPPPVIKEPGFLRDVTAVPASAPATASTPSPVSTPAPAPTPEGTHP
jgi:hypothetical protein